MITNSYITKLMTDKHTKDRRTPNYEYNSPLA